MFYSHLRIKSHCRLSLPAAINEETDFVEFKSFQTGDGVRSA
jgi:hypothetical protein